MEETNNSAQNNTGGGAGQSQSGGGTQSGVGGMGTGAQNTQARMEEAASGLEGWLASMFEKFPHIPENGRTFIVDALPWVALVFGVWGLWGMLSVFRFASLGMSIGYFGFGPFMLLSVGLSLVGSILLLVAFPGLRAKAKKGWNFMFYSQIVSFAGGVVSMLSYAGMYGMGTGLIISLVFFWLIFEVRTYYK